MSREMSPYNSENMLFKALMILAEHLEQAAREIRELYTTWTPIGHHNPDKLIPVCDQCLHELFEMFGEINLDVYDINDPYFLNALIKDVNEQFEWHEKMRKIIMKKEA